MTGLNLAGTKLAERVASLDVKTVFALAGAGHTHFLLPLKGRGIRIVGARHETGAVGAADGYARATGNLGIAAIIAEQGLPNAITPISTAYHHGTAMVVLVTRFPDSWIEAAGEFAVDHHRLVEPVCKWVRTVPCANKLSEYFDTACRIAQAGRPGPTVLVIPQDFLATPVVASEVTTLAPSLANAVPDGAALHKAAQMISRAKRPAILVDTGLLDADIDGVNSSTALQILNKDFGLPVFTYGSARGILPENQSSVLPWPYAQKVLPEIDLLLVAGVRLNMWFGFGRAPRFPDQLKVIQFDTQAEEIGRNCAVELGAAGDPAAALKALSLILKADKVSRFSTDWINNALSSRQARVDALVTRGGVKVHALELLSALEEARPNNGIFAADGADILNWSQAVNRVKRKRGYMDHHPLGSMGVALPLALGAAAAERDQAKDEGREPVRTTLLTGDGSLGFYIAELDTIFREDLPITVVVGNDGQWGTEVHGQRLMTGQSVNTTIGVGEYAKIAEGFGWRGFVVNALEDLQPALKQAYSGKGPALVDVRIDPEAGSALKTDPDLSFLIFSDLAPPSN